MKEKKIGLLDDDLGYLDDLLDDDLDKDLNDKDPELDDDDEQSIIIKVAKK